jgi:hypothetical protein
MSGGGVDSIYSMFTGGKWEEEKKLEFSRRE